MLVKCWVAIPKDVGVIQMAPSLLFCSLVGFGGVGYIVVVVVAGCGLLLRLCLLPMALMVSVVVFSLVLMS